jgi:hypothetical protein
MFCMQGITHVAMTTIPSELVMDPKARLYLTTDELRNIVTQNKIYANAKQLQVRIQYIYICNGATP